ncbi:MAG: pyridoxal phosphate-dependent aminotransferase [Tannerella sp.]|jgi:aspartate aminotransferase|nr:pyridoxal phosphate-dependent aminotransferase [Tannerella sp.]
MEHLSARLSSLSPSETLAMSQKSSELRAQGIDVINLSVGEPDFNTPEHIKAAAKKAIDDNYSFYSPVAGFPDLRRAIVEKLKRENGLDYTIDQIVVSNGAKQSIFNVMFSVLGWGDELVIPGPYWVSYLELPKLTEAFGVIVRAGIEQDFKITPEQLEEAITHRTRMVILCSPSNPTGSVYSRDELKALAGVLEKHPNVIILSDEIYEHINYAGKHESISQFVSVRNRVVIVNGVSKAYAMTGWRIGFIAAPLWIAQACNKLQGQITSGPSSIAQKASVAAFSGDQACVEEMRLAFLRRRDLIVSLCREIPDIRLNVPQGAFYIFPEVGSYYGKSAGGRKVENAADLAMYLLEEGHVATVGGAAFGAPGCIRLSYATSDENIIEAVRRIREALSRLK